MLQSANTLLQLLNSPINGFECFPDSLVNLDVLGREVDRERRRRRCRGGFRRGKAEEGRRKDRVRDGSKGRAAEVGNEGLLRRFELSSRSRVSLERRQCRGEICLKPFGCCLQGERLGILDRSKNLSVEVADRRKGGGRRSRLRTDVRERRLESSEVREGRGDFRGAGEEVGVEFRVVGKKGKSRFERGLQARVDLVPKPSEEIDDVETGAGGLFSPDPTSRPDLVLDTG